jgi:hypothetical protein
MKNKIIKTFLLFFLLITLSSWLYFTFNTHKTTPPTAKISPPTTEPTVRFNCGDWKLAVYKPNDTSDYITVESFAWGMGWGNGEVYNLKKPDAETLKKYSKNPLQVINHFDKAEKKMIYDNIDTNGWTLYYAEDKEVLIWNNGKKWFLQNHPCQGHIQEEESAP